MACFMDPLASLLRENLEVRSRRKGGKELGYCKSKQGPLHRYNNSGGKK